MAAVEMKVFLTYLVEQRQFSALIQIQPKRAILYF